MALLAAPVVWADRDGGDRDGRGDDRDECDRRSSDRGYGGGGDLDVLGVTQDGRLICFEDDDPGDAETVGKITGLVGDTKLVGIDYRPANGALYGLGDQGGVYTVNDQTAAATKVSQLSVALNGTSFGVDFNPVVDRMRIISDTGQNLRANVDTGATLVDGTVSYTPPAAATGVTGAAYTNNDGDANTATTLFDVDSSLDQVAIQSPANSGQLVATGKLGVDTNAVIGSDIYATVRNGVAVDNDAFASLTVGGKSAFYSVNPLTGKASSRGAFAAKNQVTAIAIPLNQL